MEDLSLRRLRYFLAVAEHRHFGKAAARLFISQPSLSAEVKRLERDLGVTLLERSSRAVRLTPAGARLQDDAARLLAEAGALRRNVLRPSAMSGRLTIGFVNTMLHRGLPEVARVFTASYPEVDIHLVELSSAEQAAKLDAGEIDLAIGHDVRTAAPTVSAVVVDEQFAVALPAEHPLAQEPSLAVGQLAGEALIVFRREVSPHYHDTVIALCVSAGFSPEIHHEVMVWQSAIALVEDGLGVAVVPSIHARLAATRPTSRGLVFAQLSDAKITSKTYGRYLADGPAAPAAQEFLAALMHHLASSAR